MSWMLLSWYTLICPADPLSRACPEAAPGWVQHVASESKAA